MERKSGSEMFDDMKYLDAYKVLVPFPIFTLMLFPDGLIEKEESVVRNTHADRFTQRWKERERWMHTCTEGSRFSSHPQYLTCKQAVQRWRTAPPSSVARQTCVRGQRWSRRLISR